jgi:hypothetical protein
VTSVAEQDEIIDDGSPLPDGKAIDVMNVKLDRSSKNGPRVQLAPLACCIVAFPDCLDASGPFLGGVECLSLWCESAFPAWMLCSRRFKPVDTILEVWNMAVGKPTLPLRFTEFLCMVMSSESASIFNEPFLIVPSRTRWNTIVNDPFPYSFRIAPNFMSNVVRASTERDVLIDEPISRESESLPLCSLPVPLTLVIAEEKQNGPVLSIVPCKAHDCCLALAAIDLMAFCMIYIHAPILS